MDNITQNFNFNNENILNLSDYISSVNFLDLLTEISKFFLLNDKIKNKKEDIIWLWMTVKLRILIKKFFPNQNININFRPKIQWLINNTNYELSINYNWETIIVINIKYILSNISINFQRMFDDIVINTVNIHHYKWIEYVRLMILSEETPMFSHWLNKKFEKYEKISTKYLIKATNLSLLKSKPVYLPILILNKNVIFNENKSKNSMKQLKIKYCNLKKISDLFIKYWYDELVFLRIKNTVLEEDIYNVLNKILLLIKTKISNIDM